MIFFFQFLQVGGRWEEYLRECPLHYTGNRGSGALNVMGTVLLSVLASHWRYAHINAIRGDGINPRLLGLDGVVSEDAVRLAMARIEETAGLDWISTQILGSISPALGLPWILDMDVTVKPLYGHQQGAEIGYNPHPPREGGNPMDGAGWGIEEVSIRAPREGGDARFIAFRSR